MKISSNEPHIKTKKIFYDPRANPAAAFLANPPLIWPLLGEVHLLWNFANFLEVFSSIYDNIFMLSLPPDQLIAKLNWRYAVKKFNPNEKIPEAIWNQLEEALVLSPSSYGLQPWKFLIIKDPAVRDSLLPHSYNQKQITEASHFVVFAVKDIIDQSWIEKYIERIAEVQNIDKGKLDGYKKIMIEDLVKGSRQQTIKDWASRQVYIALGNLMTCAALLDVDTCALEGLVPSKYDEILALSGSGYSTLCALALGYRSQDDRFAKVKKVRFQKSDVIKYY